jgi:hypothetical protein
MIYIVYPKSRKSAPLIYTMFDPLFLSLVSEPGSWCRSRLGVEVNRESGFDLIRISPNPNPNWKSEKEALTWALPDLLPPSGVTKMLRG